MTPLRTAFILLVVVLCCCSSGQNESLIEACGDGDAKRVERLISEGADVNAFALDMWTPLTAAANAGKLEVVTILVERGADVNKPVGDLSPLFFAARAGHLNLVKYLLAHGAKLNLPHDRRQYLIDRILRHQDRELTDLLSSQF